MLTLDNFRDWIQGWMKIYRRLPGEIIQAKAITGMAAAGLLKIQGLYH